MRGGGAPWAGGLGQVALPLGASVSSLDNGGSGRDTAGQRESGNQAPSVLLHGFIEVINIKLSVPGTPSAPVGVSRGGRRWGRARGHAWKAPLIYSHRSRNCKKKFGANSFGD